MKESKKPIGDYQKQFLEMPLVAAWQLKIEVSSRVAYKSYLVDVAPQMDTIKIKKKSSVVRSHNKTVSYLNLNRFY